MTFWWLNMETSCKCLSLSSCSPQLVQLLSCWKEIQCTLFNAFYNSSHSICYFGLWQVSPPPGPVFSPTAGEPLAVSPRLPLTMQTHFVGSPAVWQENEPLKSGGSWHCWQTILQWREGAGRPDSCVRWGLQRISAGAVSVLCVTLTMVVVLFCFEVTFVSPWYYHSTSTTDWKVKSCLWLNLSERKNRGKPGWVLPSAGGYK